MFLSFLCGKKGGRGFNKKIYDLLYVGRLEKMKGLDKLFESIKIIKNKYINNIKIAIVGDGSEKNFLLNLSKNLRIKENITFINPTYNIDDIMKKSKILVLPFESINSSFK